MKTTTRRLLLSTLALFAASLILPALSPRSQAASSLGSIRKGIGAVTSTTKRQAKKKSKKTGDDSGIVEEDIPKWYVELVPSYLHVGNTHIDTLRGGNVAFGWRIDSDDKVQFEIGYDTGNYSGSLGYQRFFYAPGSGRTQPAGDYSFIYNWVNLSGQASAKVKMIPMFFSYSYCIGLANSRRFELRLTPAIGFFGMSSSYNLGESTGTYVPYINDKLANPDPGTITMKVRVPGYSGSESFKLAFSVGAGAGFTWNITSRLYVDVAYRYFWVNHVRNILKDNGIANTADGSFSNFDPGNLVARLNSPAFNNSPANYPELIAHMSNGELVSVGTAVWNGTVAWNNMNVHSYTFAIGWKF